MPNTKNKWYSKVLKDYSRKTLITVGVTLLLLFIMTIIQITKGHAFVWDNITPIEQPGIFERDIYSALTFLTLGAFLYFIRFYQVLSWLFGSNREGYRAIKGLIWLGLMWIMYTTVVPTTVNVLNFTISFLYNISLILLYVSPIALVILLAVIGFL